MLVHEHSIHIIPNRRPTTQANVEQVYNESGRLSSYPFRPCECT